MDDYLDDFSDDAPLPIESPDKEHDENDNLIEDLLQGP